MSSIFSFSIIIFVAIFRFVSSQINSSIMFSSNNDWKNYADGAFWRSGFIAVPCSCFQDAGDIKTLPEVVRPSISANQVFSLSNTTFGSTRSMPCPHASTSAESFKMDPRVQNSTYKIELETNDNMSVPADKVPEPRTDDRCSHCRYVTPLSPFVLSTHCQNFLTVPSLVYVPCILQPIKSLQPFVTAPEHFNGKSQSDSEIREHVFAMGNVEKNASTPKEKQIIIERETTPKPEEFSELEHKVSLAGQGEDYCSCSNANCTDLSVIAEENIDISQEDTRSQEYNTDNEMQNEDEDEEDAGDEGEVEGDGENSCTSRNKTRSQDELKYSYEVQSQHFAYDFDDEANDFSDGVGSCKAETIDVSDQRDEMFVSEIKARKVKSPAVTSCRRSNSDHSTTVQMLMKCALEELMLNNTEVMNNEEQEGKLESLMMLEDLTTIQDNTSFNGANWEDGLTLDTDADNVMKNIEEQMTQFVSYTDNIWRDLHVNITSDKINVESIKSEQKDDKFQNKYLPPPTQKKKSHFDSLTKLTDDTKTKRVKSSKTKEEKKRWVI